MFKFILYNSITSSGAIESSNTKNIASEVSAKVKKVNVKVCDKVSKNAVIFDVIEDNSYVLKIKLPYFDHSPINEGDVVSMIHLDSFGIIEGVITYISDIKTKGQYGGELVLVLENSDLSDKITSANDSIDNVKSNRCFKSKLKKESLLYIVNSLFKFHVFLYF